GLRRRGWRGGLLAVGAIAVGGTALAATAPWTPQVGDREHDAPGITREPIPADQRRLLGVLRRPQTDADRGPRVRAILRMLAGEATTGLRVDGVRLLRTLPDGGAHVLLPFERVGPKGRGRPQWRRRRNVLCSFISQASTLPGSRRGAMSMGGSCGTAADVRAGRMMGGAQWAGHLGASGVVPDGVKTVVISIHDGPTFRLPVRDNAYYLDARVPAGRHYNPNNVRWYDARGKQVHRAYR
ncbi:hypothetical protein ACVU7I_02280, partial [Patulibacter sp. S7RM1-6]